MTAEIIYSNKALKLSDYKSVIDNKWLTVSSLTLLVLHTGIAFHTTLVFHPTTTFVFGGPV